MGFRTPQELSKQAPQQGTGRAVFRRPSGAQISGEFLQSASSIVSAQKAREEKARKAKEDFLNAVFENKLDTLRVQAQSELASQKGSNVFDKMPSIKKGYLDGIRDAVDELPEQYRKSPEIQKRIIKKAGDFDRFAIGHSFNESNKLREEVFNARVSNDVNTFSENAADISYLTGEGIDTVEASIRQKALYEYGSGPEGKLLADQDVRLGVSKAIKQAVQMQVASNNFGLAEQTVEQLYERITDEDKQDLKKIIRKAKEDNADDMALSLANEAFAIAPENANAREKYIRALSGTDSDMYRKAIGLVETRSRIQQRQEDEDNKDRYNTLYDQYVNTGSMDNAMLANMPRDMRDKLFDALQKNGGRAPVISTPGLLQSAIEDLTQLSDEQIVKMDFEKAYQHSLNRKDIDKLNKFKAQAQSRIQSQITQGQKFSNEMIIQVIDRFDKKYSLGKKGSKEYDDMYGMLVDRAMEIQEQNPKITSNELRKLLTKDMQEKIIYEQRSFIFDSLWPDKLEIPESFTNDIPPDLYRKVNAAQRLRGRPELNEKQMREFLRSIGRLP